MTATRKETPLRIMVIDDDAAAGIALGEILKKHSVTAVASYGQFIETAAGHRPDILLLDVDLPGADGIEVCKTLRNSPEYSDMMIILITPHADEMTITGGYEAGASDYIRKPFIPYEIRAKIALIERIIGSAKKLRKLNSALTAKNRKFQEFGLFIQAGMHLSSLEDRVGSASKLQVIIGADSCAAFRIADREIVPLSSGVFGPAASFTDITKIAGSINLKDIDKIYFAEIKKGPVRKWIAIMRLAEGGTSCGFMLFEKGTPFDSDDREVISMYAGFLDILGERSAIERVIHVNNEEYKREIQKIRTIQVSLMPHFKDIAGFDIASTYLPAKELSGDFIDAYFIDKDTYQIIICDVSGHGIASSYVGNEFRTIFRISSRPGNGPKDITAQVNSASTRDFKSLYYYCTVILCQISLSTGRIRYTVAGHPNPLLYHADEDRVEQLEQTGTLIGLFDDGAEYNESEIFLKQGDCLFIYTDGVTEAYASINGERSMFGTKRLSDILMEQNSYSSRDILHFVISSVYEYTDYRDQDDDITAVCIKRM